MQALIVTLAEYQTIFWINVAKALAGSPIEPRFLAFDDRSVEMIEEAGFPVVSGNAPIVPDTPEHRAQIFRRSGIDGLGTKTSHERFAFNRNDTDAMLGKLAGAVAAAEQAIADARAQSGDVVMIQEVGGFLSVIGAFYAARAAGVDCWFVEPSFFRGRMILTKNSFAAPAIENRSVSPSADMRTYIDRTLAQGSIVIPEKDAHQYRNAFSKVVNFKNARRLVEKLVDKHVLGKKQEFGFIGHHVGSHLKMIANSRKLTSSYTKLENLDRFIYYPLHVPGDMALTIRSPEYLDQLALVDYLCRTVPDGYRIALKEHPAMVGAISADRMIELLRRYDHLALLPPTTNNYAVMRKADCIVTVNSKSGAEAGLLGKRVLVLGDAFYGDAPFARRVPSITALPDILREELNGLQEDLPAPAHVDWFARVWEASRPGELFVTDAPRAAQFAQSLVELIRTGEPDVAMAERFEGKPSQMGHSRSA